MFRNASFETWADLNIYPRPNAIREKKMCGHVSVGSFYPECEILIKKGDLKALIFPLVAGGLN